MSVFQQNKLIPRVPRVATRKEPTLTCEEWYQTYAYLIDRCISTIIAKLHTACTNNSTSEKEIVINTQPLHDALVQYIYKTSYSRFRSWE